jgi:effector-binding domain-containing protein
MPLADIRAFLADGNLARLDDYERTIVDELHERRLVLRYLRKRLKEETMFTVHTKRVDATPYVSRTAKVSVRDLERFITETIGELWSSVTPTAPAFTLYHGEVSEEDDGPAEVGVPTTSGDRELPAAEVAFTVARGDQTRYPEILGAYDAVAEWATRNGRELAGPPREIYLSDPVQGEQPVMEIAWPVR